MVVKTWMVVVGLMAGVVVGTTEVSAQVLGTFRWQLAPFCNVVSLRVEQKGALYELSGTDDRCGGPQAAAASGTAHVNPSGTASIALTVIRPDGIPVASNASIDLITLSGTWSDEYGNSGAFTYNPPGVGGLPRQVTLRGSYGIVFNATAGAQHVTSAISFGRMLPAAPLVPSENLIQSGESPTLNCPGSFDSPQAAPGHLCIYEQNRQNSSLFTVMDNAIQFDRADAAGGTVVVRSAAAGVGYATGRWAVTIP